MRIDIGERAYEIELPEHRRWPRVRRVLAHLVFAACIVAVVALALANVLAWRGDLPGLDDDRQPAAAAAATSSSAPAGQGPGAGIPRAAPAHLTITARGGPCYLVVREGNRRGEVLFRGTLVPGQTVQLAGPRLWMRAGATQNIALSLDGEPVVGLPEGAAALVVTRAGVRPASGPG